MSAEFSSSVTKGFCPHWLQNRVSVWERGYIKREEKLPHNNSKYSNSDSAGSVFNHAWQFSFYNWSIIRVTQMTTTPYEYPLEERKMHQSSGHQEPYKEARIYCRLRYPFQAVVSFTWKHTLEILFHFLWTKSAVTLGENLFSSEGDPDTFPHPSHASRGHNLTASHNLFLSLGREDVPGFLSPQIAVRLHTQSPGWILQTAFWKQQVNL